MSIACWIIVYSPQIYENYTLQSGEGLSVLFVVTWLLGDITNLVGASMAGLLPTVILLAIYVSEIWRFPFFCPTLSRIYGSQDDSTMSRSVHHMRHRLARPDILLPVAISTAPRRHHSRRDFASSHTSPSDYGGRLRDSCREAIQASRMRCAVHVRRALRRVDRRNRVLRQSCSTRGGPEPNGPNRWWS